MILCFLSLSQVRRPALHELDQLKGKKTVRIIDLIAHKWHQVAIRLHFELYEIKCMERDHQWSSDASREMLMKWLKCESSVREPITWGTLIQVLEEADLAEVAWDIKSILLESDT